MNLYDVYWKELCWATICLEQESLWKLLNRNWQTTSCLINKPLVSYCPCGFHSLSIRCWYVTARKESCTRIGYPRKRGIYKSFACVFNKENHRLLLPRFELYLHMDEVFLIETRCTTFKTKTKLLTCCEVSNRIIPLYGSFPKDYSLIAQQRSIVKEHQG